VCLSGVGSTTTTKANKMKLCVATWVCLAGILSGGSVPGQQSLPTPAAPSELLTEKKEPAPPPKHKLGPLEISANWRTRAEATSVVADSRRTSLSDR
jgi:hypothetical protein